MAKGKSRIDRGKYLTGAFLFIIRYPLLLSAVICFILGGLEKDTTLLQTGAVLGVLSLIVIILFLVVSSTVLCRLCRAQFLRNLKCSKKENAPSFMGNYNIPVAFAILARSKRIRCPYCGEKHSYFANREPTKF